MNWLRTRRALKRRIVELEDENKRLLDKTFFCRPERPIIVWLLATLTGDQWLWYWRVLGSGYFWSTGNGTSLWSSKQFKEVDARYGDRVARALWQIEKDDKRL
jgi:hypothetical protein